jgi:hypothetical protein
MPRAGSPCSSAASRHASSSQHYTSYIPVYSVHYNEFAATTPLYTTDETISILELTVSIMDAACLYVCRYSLGRGPTASASGAGGLLYPNIIPIRPIAHDEWQTVPGITLPPFPLSSCYISGRVRGPLSSLVYSLVRAQK